MSIDAPANNAKCPDDSVTSTLTWVTDEAPSDIFAEGDAGNRKLERHPRLALPIFAVLDFLPGNALHGQHRSDTIDYVICTKVPSTCCSTIRVGGSTNQGYPTSQPGRRPVSTIGDVRCLEAKQRYGETSPGHGAVGVGP